MSPLELLAIGAVASALTFVAGRQSVKRRFSSIKNSSGHTLIVRLDDHRVLHIESATNQEEPHD